MANITHTYEIKFYIDKSARFNDFYENNQEVYDRTLINKKWMK